MTMIRVDAHTFRDRVVHMRMCMKPPLGYSLHLHTISEYRNMRCYFDDPDQQGNWAGFALQEDGELVNLFALRNGHGDRLVEAAIALGARRLDCYEGVLSDLYRRHGFVEISRMPWDSRYAHPEWIESRYGTPDVLEMSVKLPLDGLGASA